MGIIMAYAFVCSLALLVASPQHDVCKVLCRASVIANRASILVTSDELLYRNVDLAKSFCDGPSDNCPAVASLDIARPWYGTLNRYHTDMRREQCVYPDVLLRHSYSKHGLFVGNYNNFSNFNGEYLVSLVSSSLPRLENDNRDLRDLGDIARAGTNFLSHQCVGPNLEPLERRPQLSRVRGKPVARGPGTIFYDFLVTNTADCELYVAAFDGGVEGHVHSVLPTRQTTRPGGSEGVPWEQRYVIPGDIDGPFAVVPHKKARYLVTPAGAVVRMVGPDGKAEPKLVAVYDKSKVLAVVHDTDEEVRYAFTATHFFEVAEPVVLKPHAVKKFDTSNGAAGLETAFHCARAVRGLPPVPFPPPPK